MMHFFTSNIKHHNKVLIDFLEKIGVDSSKIQYLSNEKYCYGCYLYNSRLAIAIAFVLKSYKNTIVLHGQFNPFVWIFLYLGLVNTKNIKWIIWGGDLYPTKQESFFHNVYNYIKKQASKKIDFVYGFKYDCLNFKNINDKALYKQLFHPIPINWDKIDEINKIKKEDSTINILLGNSAELTNNFEEAIDVLSIYKNEENIKIYFPFSYGSYTNRHDEIIKKAKKVFGDKKIILIRDFMSMEQYLEFLGRMDIVLYANDRQEGVGTLVNAILLGKKVFVKKGTSTSFELRELEIEIFDFEDIKRLNYEKFISKNFNIFNNYNNVIKLTNKGMSSVWKNEFYVN